MPRSLSQSALMVENPRELCLSPGSCRLCAPRRFSQFVPDELDEHAVAGGLDDAVLPAHRPSQPSLSLCDKYNTGETVTATSSRAALRTRLFPCATSGANLRPAFRH